MNNLKCLFPQFVKLLDTKKNLKNIIWQPNNNKIDFKVKYSRIIIRLKDFFTKKTAKILLYIIQYMEEDIQNYSPNVMFRGTPCI